MRRRHDQHSQYVKVALALFWVLLVLPSTLMAGTVTLGTPSSSSVTEGPSTTVTIPLTISDTIFTDFTLSYTISGIGITGSDYNDTTGSITLNAGDNSGTVLPDIVLEIPQDSLVEATETLTIELNDPANGTDSVSGSQAITITDNDGQASISIDDVTVDESAGTASFTVSLNKQVDTDVEVTYTLGASGDTATFSSDYAANATTPSPVTIPAGSNSTSLLVNVTDDSLVDLDPEMFTVTLGSPSAASRDVVIGDGIGTGTITDNDGQASISIDDVTVDESAGTASFTVSLNKQVDTDVEVTYTLGASGDTATLNSDYAANATTPSPVTIPAGSNSTSLLVNVTDDSLVDLDPETFTVTLGSPSAAGRDVVIGDGIGTGTITDNDGQASISIDDVTVDESAGTASFTVSLNKQVDTDVEVTYTLGASGDTATLNSDYAANATTPSPVTIPAGSNSTSLLVNVTDDSLVDLDPEMFTVTLGSPSAASRDVVIGDGIGTGTITDNDGQASISIDDVTVDESAGTASFTVSLNKQVDTDVEVTYTLGASGDTATLNQ